MIRPVPIRIISIFTQEGVDSYHYAARPPNVVGRYRNTDPVLISYLIRLGVEKSGEEYLSFPQRALFDRLGIRTMRIETDPHPSDLLFASTREWSVLLRLCLVRPEQPASEGLERFLGNGGQHSAENSYRRSPQGRCKAMHPTVYLRS
jgi:hypothetical protein